MRIDPDVVDSPTPLDTTKPQVPAKTSGAPAGSSVVVLSSAANAPAPGAGPPPIAERVEEIRALLEKGEYPVDLELLAARIVDDDAARSGRPS